MCKENEKKINSNRRCTRTTQLNVNGDRSNSECHLWNAVMTRWFCEWFSAKCIGISIKCKWDEKQLDLVLFHSNWIYRRNVHRYNHFAKHEIALSMCLCFAWHFNYSTNPKIWFFFLCAGDCVTTTCCVVCIWILILCRNPCVRQVRKSTNANCWKLRSIKLALATLNLYKS